MSPCEGKNGGEWQCGNPAVFAIWYSDNSDSAKGACGKHVSQVIRDMLANAPDYAGRFVKVTGVKQ